MKRTRSHSILPLISIRSLGILALLLAIQACSGTLFLQDGTELFADNVLDTMNNTTNISQTPFPIQFFYNTHCGSCQASIEYLTEFTRTYPEVGVSFHDLYNNTTNLALYEQYRSRYARNDIHYPVIFIGDIGIMGSPDITSHTEPLTLWYQHAMKRDLISGVLSWVSSFLKDTAYLAQNRTPAGD